MPLLEHVSWFYRKTDLEGVQILWVQHILWTTRAMFEFLVRNHNLDPASVHLLGKCYSTHPETWNKMREIWMHIHERSIHFDRRYWFDTYHRVACVDLLENSWINRKRPTIIVDDWGELIYQTIQRDFDWRMKTYAAIEQTSSWYTRNKKIFHPFWGYEREPEFRLINIARSEAKLILETPHIIDAIVSEFRKKILHHNLVPQKILVIWMGIIGTALVKKLQSEWFDVECFDKHSGQHLTEAVKTSNVIFGTTGDNILPEIEVFLQENTMLISCSSSDREFGWRILKERYPWDIIDCHKDLELDRGIILVNGGFPINFNWEEHSVPPKKIQLTRALIMAAILSWARTGESLKWPHPLEQEVHDSIMEEFLKIQSTSVWN